ncbi:asialoglycoprotein receptor 2-like isoform X2 [Labrus mixtus]|uniref:asialoglycoprotein receptor 2-like isoform X2 n=1 Tax=Labrus mixtus TaxID=508554 RepID=UPI0029C0B4A8|nr:asialoglycoprotein receptor 2-like isoform X2 [Labrus mixtus]
MSTPGGSLPCDGMYSKLIDDEASYDELNRRPDVGHSGHPVSHVRVIPRPSGPVLYRLATICLATLCAILLISVIAVSTHYKNKSQGGAEATAEAQKQTQDFNVSALTVTISKLQKEREELQKQRDELQKQRDELQAKLDAKPTAKAPDVVRPTTKAPIICPPDWLLFNNSCYFISRNTRSWPESKSFCESKGAYLAIIHTAEEQFLGGGRTKQPHQRGLWLHRQDASVRASGDPELVRRPLLHEPPLHL